MQASSNESKTSFRSLAMSTRLGLLLILIFGLDAAGNAQKPAVVVSETSVVFDTQGGGGFNAQQAPNGGSFGVDPYGDIAISLNWTNYINVWNGTTGTLTSITTVPGPVGATLDRQRNLFVNGLYDNKLLKLPYVNGNWVTGDLTKDPACTGNDTVECVMPNLSPAVSFKNTAFDAAGNLFMVTATDNVNGGNKIYVLTAANLYTGPPVLVYTDDATHAIASIAFDPWGNLFFTDVVYASGGQSTQKATSAYLNVLPYSSTAGYASSKTVLVTHTITSPSDYDNALSGVAVDRSGTVYFSDINGTYGIPNNPLTAPDGANAYLVSPTGGKQLMTDGNGNLYSVGYDAQSLAILRILLNNVVVPPTTVGTESAINVVAALNRVDCTGTVTFAYVSGSTTTASAAPAGTCRTDSLAGITGAYLPVTAKLTPTAGATSVAAMTATDSSGHSTGFTVTGGTLAGRQAVVVSETSVVFDTQGGGGFNAQQAPNGGSFGVDPYGDIAISLNWTNYINVWNGTTSTLTSITTVPGPVGATLDRQRNLFVNGLYDNKLLKLPYVNGNWVTGDLTKDSACTGNDTVECVMPNLSPAVSFKNTAFDSSGNLFMVTATDNVHGGNKIYVLSAANLYTGPPVLVYTDDAAHAIASIAVDPWGNLFFTDVVYASGGQSTQKATSAYLNVLPYSSTAGYASSKTVLVTHAITSPADYDNALSSVAADANGTVYYADGTGTFALPNNPLTPADIASAYLVSNTGGKQLMPDGNGGLYSVWYDSSGKQAVLHFGVNNIVVPAVTIGAESKITDAGAALNSVDCSGAADFTFAGGTASSASAAITGNCSTVSFAGASGSMFGATVSMTPLVSGVNTAVLTAVDSAHNTSTLNVSGYGNPITGLPQIITFPAPPSPVTYKPGLQITVAATGGQSGNPVVFSVDPASTAAATVSGTTLTVTQAGTLIINANQSGGDVDGTQYADAAQVQRTVVVNKGAQTLTFAAPTSPVIMAPSLTVSLSATAGASSSPVVFKVDPTSTGSGTIAANVLTPTGVGTIVIDANQDADTNYLAAPQVQQSVVVNQGTQSIGFIPLTQPLHYIMGGIQVQISANGGPTNNPIVFSVDPASPVTGTFSKSKVSGSTSMATLTIKDQASLANFPASIVITATQPGNANYADAPAVSETIALLKPLPTQAITFGNPGTQVVGTPLALAAIASSGFAVAYDASTTPTICTVDNATSTATFKAAGACSITALQPGDNVHFAAAVPVTVTFAVNASGQAPSMNMSLSLSSLTMQAGTVGLTQLTVNSVNNFTGAVSLSCTGAPSGYSCSFNPTTITAFTADAKTGLPLGTTGSSQLSISGTSATAAHGNSRPLLPIISLGIALCCLGFRKRRRLQLMLLLVIAAAGLGLFAGCGGSSSSSKKQPATSQITITATAGKTTQSATLTLIIE